MSRRQTGREGVRGARRSEIRRGRSSCTPRGPAGVWQEVRPADLGHGAPDKNPICLPTSPVLSSTGWFQGPFRLFPGVVGVA